MYGQNEGFFHQRSVSTWGGWGDSYTVYVSRNVTKGIYSCDKIKAYNRVEFFNFI